MAPEAVPVNASVVSTGLGVRYVGENPMYAYAYSGAIGVPNSETTLINSISGTGIWKAIIQIAYGTPDSDDMQYKIYFNDIIVMQIGISGAVDQGNWQTMLYNFIIPPLTKIKVTAQNTTSVTERIQTASITGRVYGV